MLSLWLEHNQLPESGIVATSLGQLKRWIQARLATLEESISAANVDKLLKSQNLFPEADDLIDPLGDPPPEPRYSWQI